MTLEIKKSRSEWLVAEQSTISVCAGVNNGEVTTVKINGIKDGSIYTDLVDLKHLFHCAAEILEGVRAAQERTRLPEKEGK